MKDLWAIFISLSSFFVPGTFVQLPSFSSPSKAPLVCKTLFSAKQLRLLFAYTCLLLSWPHLAHRQTNTCTDPNESQSHTHIHTVAALVIICCFATLPRVLSHTDTLVPLTSARLWSLLGGLVNLWCDWQLQPAGPRVCVLSVKLATERLQYTRMHLVVRVCVLTYFKATVYSHVVRELLFFSASCLSKWEKNPRATETMFFFSPSQWLYNQVFLFGTQLGVKQLFWYKMSKSCSACCTWFCSSWRNLNPQASTHHLRLYTIVIQDPPSQMIFLVVM